MYTNFSNTFSEIRNEQKPNEQENEWNNNLFICINKPLYSKLMHSHLSTLQTPLFTIWVNLMMPNHS